MARTLIPNSTQIPDVILDRWLARLNGAEFKVVMYIARRTYGFGKGEGDTYGWLYSAYAGRSTYGLPRPLPASYLSLPPGTRKVIALDLEIAEKFAEGHGPQPLSLADGSVVYILQSERADIAALVLKGDSLRAVFEQG